MRSGLEMRSYVSRTSIEVYLFKSIMRWNRLLFMLLSVIAVSFQMCDAFDSSSMMYRPEICNKKPIRRSMMMSTNMCKPSDIFHRTSVFKGLKPLHLPPNKINCNKFAKNVKALTSRNYVAMQGQDGSIVDNAQNINGERSINITGRDYGSAAALALLICYVSVKLIFWSNPESYRYYLAGGICASLSHTITTPIDVVKTRQQVDPSVQNKGLIKATLSLVKKDGLKVLLAGLGPTTIGYLFEGAAKFGIYEGLKPSITNILSAASLFLSLPQLNSRLLSFALCGCVSGFVASLLLCPMEALRIRLVAEPEFAKLGFVDGGIHMVKKEGGFRGVYKGLNAMVTKQVPYTVTKQVTFDTIISIAAANIAIDQLTSHVKFMITFVAAMAAAGLSAISSQPGDTLLSLVNAHEGSKSTSEFSKELMNKEGIRGFFVGMKARFLHVGVMVTIQLLLYDFFKRLCGVTS